MGLTRGTLIYKSDGTKVPLTSIKEGDMLLGFDNGHLIESPVISRTILPARQDWMKLGGPRIGYNKGMATFSLTATPDQVIGKEGKSVSDLEIGDTLPAVFNSLFLTEVQKSILLGILLGDGSLQKASSSGGSKSLTWSHSSKQEDYLDWTVQALGGLAKRRRIDLVSGYGSVMHTAQTIFHPDIEHALSGFDKPAGDIPSWVTERLNPISMAFWYMDDGSLSHNEGQRDRAHLATDSFSKNSIEILIKALAKFGISANMQKHKKGYGLRLNAESADLFFCLIAPYIPPSMQYKLPVYYRGNQGWIPTSKFEFKKIIVEALINHSAPYTIPTKAAGAEYVLKTESGNFFAHGILLSNS